MSFLSTVGHWLTTSANWTGVDGVPERLWLQIVLSAAVVVTASFIGVGLGFLLGHTGRGGFIAVNAANAARAVPSLALLTLLAISPAIGLKGGGFDASYIALVALGIPPVLTNAYVGMREVDPEVKEAARASGMSGTRAFFRIEVPLALPLAVAGVRTAAIEVVATSTLAAYASYNDLGGYIFSGFDTNNTVETFCGALLVTVLAGLTDLALLGLYRLVTPAALRRGGVVDPELSRGVVRPRPRTTLRTVATDGA